MQKSELNKLRINYQKGFFLEENCSENPINQFNTWLSDALNSEIREPNAMVVSTIKNAMPFSRIVLLKQVDQKGFVFFTNYESAKGIQISENPNGCLTIFWDLLERQVRINGVFEKIDPKESDAYFHSRPLSSQIGAWVSNQSEVIKSRDELEKKETYFRDKFSGLEEIPRPEHWGGYRLVPNVIEFWQGRTNRLHDRLLYTKQSNAWKIERLSP